jgi:hypothetical protein
MFKVTITTVSGFKATYRFDTFSNALGYARTQLTHKVVSSATVRRVT